MTSTVYRIAFAAVLGQLALPDGHIESRAATVTQNSLATNGVIHLYVDPSGSDSNTCTAPGALACATPQGAVNKLPKRVQHLEQVTIACAASNTNADYYLPSTYLCSGHPNIDCAGAGLTIAGFVPDPGLAFFGNGYGSSTLVGTGIHTPTTDETAPELIIEGASYNTIAGGNVVASATDSNGIITINVSGTPWTVNQFQGDFLRITSGTALGTNISPGRVYASPESDQNEYVIVSNTTNSLKALDGFTVVAAGVPSAGDTFDIVQPCVTIHSQPNGGTNGPEMVVQILNIGASSSPYELPAYDEQAGGFLKIRNIKITTDNNAESIGLFVANGWARTWGVQVIGTSTTAHEAAVATSAGLDFLRSYVTVGQQASAALHYRDARFASTVESSFVSVSSGTGNAILTETAGEVFVQGVWATTAGAGAAIQGIGSGYMRLIGNNYVTSATGPGVFAQRGAVIRVGGVLANATGNSGTWGVRCSQSSSVFISSTTTATGTTGDASPDGTNTVAYTVIRAATPPVTTSLVENCYVGQE